MKKWMIKGIRRVNNIYYIDRPFPLFGHLYFGIIDRGLNIIQARISSLCNLSCKFCSVDAGLSTRRISDFLIVNPEWMADSIRMVVDFKNDETDVIFDAAGDPITNKLLPEFIAKIRNYNKIRWIILESRLHGASTQFIDELAEAGLDRINVSIDTLNPSKAITLAGNSSYNIESIKRLVEYAFHEKGIDIHIAPVWIPGFNDEDIERIIEWAIKNGFGKRIPPLGIQKYVVHKHGRKIEGIKEPTWKDWRDFLYKLETKYSIKLILEMSDYDLRKSKQYKPIVKKNDEIWAIIVGEGPYNKEYLAVTRNYESSLTIVSKRETFEVGDVVLTKIIRDKDGILIGVPI